MRNDQGDITAITTDDGTVISGDLFLDCGNWLEDDVSVVDWSEWLPCNRMASMVRDSADPPTIAMQLAAHPGGWQRQGSLFGAVVDSFVFCDVVPGEWPATAVAFRAGRSEIPWRGNCVAIGDGAVIMDPISDMRLHLALSAIQRIAALLPADRDQSAEAREYNRQTIAELDHARDFAIAHYCLNNRVGDPFWDHCRTMSLPDTLRARISLYRSCGRVATMDHETQPATSWIALFDALGVRPERYDALADLLPLKDIDRHLAHVRNALVARVQAMPAYSETARLVHRHRPTSV
jgi:tryptophan 7-halogenase